MVPPLSLGRSESSWLHQNFVARALAGAPPNTILEEAPPPVTPDEAALHQKERVHHTRDVGIIWSSAHMRIVFAQRLTLLVDGVGRVRRLSLIFFRGVRSWLGSKLMLEWATQEICGVHPQWPWDSPEPLGSSLDSIRGSQGRPTPRYTKSDLGQMRWLLQHSKRVPERLSNNTNNWKILCPFGYLKLAYKFMETNFTHLEIHYFLRPTALAKMVRGEFHFHDSWWPLCYEMKPGASSINTNSFNI